MMMMMMMIMMMTIMMTTTTTTTRNSCTSANTSESSQMCLTMYSFRFSKQFNSFIWWLLVSFSLCILVFVCHLFDATEAGKMPAVA